MRKSVLRDLLEALILRDAVLHVDDVVADAEIAEVGDKGGGLRFFRYGPRRHIGLIGEIVGAEDDEVGFSKADARSERRAHDDGHAQIAGHVAGFVEHGFAAGARHAAAEPVRNLVIAQNGCQALDVALMRSGEHDPRFCFHQDSSIAR